MTEPQSFLDGRVLLHSGDCRDVLKTLADCSIDSVVTDPPYHLQSITKRFAKVGRTDKTWSKSGPHQRTANGFMNQQWDGGDIAFDVTLWAEVLRVLKPGGYIVAFSSSRTYHRMACAIEDAGFITHPMIGWIFGTGFPKAHSVSKHIDRMERRTYVQAAVYLGLQIPGNSLHDWTKAEHSPNDRWWAKFKEVLSTEQWGAIERQVIAERHGVTKSFNVGATKTIKLRDPITAPSTDAAKQWDGWYYGTQSLKPSLEPCYLGRKPVCSGYKSLNDCEDTDIIAEFSIAIEALLWILLPVKSAAFLSKFHQNMQPAPGGARLDSVRLGALLDIVLLLSGPSALMATFTSPVMASTFLSIASLWNAISDASSKSMSTSTTEMESSLIMGLKTLQSWILATIPENIIQASIEQKGVWLIASPAGKKSHDLNASWSITQPPSATENAIGDTAIRLLHALADIAAKSSLISLECIANIVRDPVQAAQQIPGGSSRVNLEPIYMGQKPFSEKTGTANVLRWGTGAINVDGCRVESEQRKHIERRNDKLLDGNVYDSGINGSRSLGITSVGRWPANLVLSIPEDEYELKPFTPREQKSELFRWLSENA